MIIQEENVQLESVCSRNKNRCRSISLYIKQNPCSPQITVSLKRRKAILSETAIQSDSKSHLEVKTCLEIVHFQALNAISLE